jgi:hypothetical protein
VKKRVVRGIRWPQDFGWRVGDDYKPPVRLASQVVRYEQEVLENETGVPEFLLAEMDRLELRPRDMLWVCLTKEAARRFARRGDGEPYRVGVGDDALVLCTDDEGGYLLLFDASRLRPQFIELFERYRADSAGSVSSANSQSN